MPRWLRAAQVVGRAAQGLFESGARSGEVARLVYGDTALDRGLRLLLEHLDAEAEILAREPQLERAQVASERQGAVLLEQRRRRAALVVKRDGGAQAGVLLQQLLVQLEPDGVVPHRQGGVRAQRAHLRVARVELGGRAGVERRRARVSGGQGAVAQEQVRLGQGPVAEGQIGIGRGRFQQVLQSGFGPALARDHQHPARAGDLRRRPRGGQAATDLVLGRVEASRRGVDLGRGGVDDRLVAETLARVLDRAHRADGVTGTCQGARAQQPEVGPRHGVGRRSVADRVQLLERVAHSALLQRAPGPGRNGSRA